MKHTHVYKVCVLSLLSLSVNGNSPSTDLSGLTFRKADNIVKCYPTSISNPLTINTDAHLKNGNPSASNFIDLKSKNSGNTLSEISMKFSGINLQKDIAEESLNYANENLFTSTSDYWESPSKVSLMRLHEFLLMEQLMQS